jgi:hypothetical protein
MADPERQYLDPSQLRPGPIRHQSLPPDLLKPIQAVYKVIGPYLDTTLEQFEIGFMRDMHPESEVAVWCSKPNVMYRLEPCMERRLLVCTFGPLLSWDGSQTTPGRGC